MYTNGAWYIGEIWRRKTSIVLLFYVINSMSKAINAKIIDKFQYCSGFSSIISNIHCVNKLRKVSIFYSRFISFHGGNDKANGKDFVVYFIFNVSLVICGVFERYAAVFSDACVDVYYWIF
jgi:phage-related holin